MTTLYRSPNVIIDRHEWHAVVYLRRERAILTYHWRPLTGKREGWRDVTTWQGPKPKGMPAAFWRFRAHIREAMGSEIARREAIAGLKGPAPDWSRVKVPGRRATLGLVA